MIVKPRHLSFYRMDTFEDRFERASVEDGDSELEIEGDDLVLLQLPGVVDVDTHQACWKAADELDAIANVFMLHPGSSKIQVIIRDVQI